jgi:hypothetical protein
LDGSPKRISPVSRLAIIIPFTGNCTALEETLVSVLENRPEECEVVVALGEPYADPYQLADEVTFVDASGLGLAAGINCALEASQAPIVHVIACGTTVGEGWTKAATTHFDDPQVAVVAPLVVDAECPERVLAAGMVYGPGGEAKAAGRGRQSGSLFPTRILAAPPCAGFYRRQALSLLGGCPDQVGPAWISLDVGLCLRQLGYHAHLEPQSRVATSKSHAPVAGHFRDALDAERFFWRWVSIHGWLRSLLLHFLLVIGESVGTLRGLAVVPRLAGRTVGACLGLFQGKQRQAVQRLRSRPRTRAEDTAPTGAHFRGDGPHAPCLVVPAARPAPRRVRTG